MQNPCQRASKLNRGSLPLSKDDLIPKQLIIIFLLRDWSLPTFTYNHFVSSNLHRQESIFFLWLDRECLSKLLNLQWYCKVAEVGTSRTRVGYKCILSLFNFLLYFLCWSGPKYARHCQTDGLASKAFLVLLNAGNQFFLPFVRSLNFQLKYLSYINVNNLIPSEANPL